MNDGLCCAADVFRDGLGALAEPLGGLEDEEGEALPEGLPDVVDCHVHLFPPAIFERIWAWFERYGWPIRYRLHAQETMRFLFARGVKQMVALHYSHKPGLARDMNRFMAELTADDRRVLGTATVLPGEPDAAAILREGLALGLGAVKLHCHVQCMAPDDPEMDAIYRVCSEAGAPLVLHAGREPKSPAYKVDTYAICAAERVEKVLHRWPDLKLLVPHLGADEFEAYHRLMLEHDNLWLDTTMVVAEYLPTMPPRKLLVDRPERLVYGTDFPNLPYAWDREVKKLAALDLGDEVLAAVLHGTARELFAFPE
ncbi:MAG: amidohydrolase [Deltaproteobacteria bacterium]|nr:MAG: amidohydrolase [Deltaproteobacteria bacterium]